MTIIRFLPAISLFLFGYISIAQPVGYPAAKKMAHNFLGNKTYKTDNNHTIQISETYIKERDNQPLLYVFKLHPVGFIIISGDFKAIPVLGYSYETEFDETNLSPALNQWLENYILEIQLARNDFPGEPGYGDIWFKQDNGIIAVQDEVNKRNSVAPLLKSIWEQGKYYNDFCPEHPEGPGGHCYAGCVALAQAQVLYYFRHPNQGDSSISYYNFPLQDTISVDFGNTTYDWNEMVNYIYRIPNHATAELIFHSGASITTYYRPEGSGSSTGLCENALKTYFRYDTSVSFYERSDTSINWKELLVENLSNLQPVIYKGGAWPAHSFVCDGFQDTSYFHFNFGFWNGSGNGYYMIDDITPFHYNFSYQQAGIFNIFPAGDYPNYASGYDTLTAWRGTFSDGSGPLPYLENTDAYWLISPEGGDSAVIMLYFNEFDTEQYQDLVTVYDGENISSAILGSFTGNTIPPTISSTGNKMLIHFHSNGSINTGGWFANYTAVDKQFCNEYTELTDTSGYFEDGSGIVYDYSNKTNCQWLIKPYYQDYDSISGIILDFNEFISEQEQDYLTVYNGPTTQSPLLLNWSGNGIPSQVISTSDEILLDFQSDMYGTRPGFSGIYHIYFPQYCSDTNILTEANGTIEDGSGAKKYVNNTDCYWHIKPPYKDTIILFFSEIDLEYGYDWVEISDPTENPPAILGHFSGNELPPALSSKNGELLIHFHSDYCNNAAGWIAEYVSENQGTFENDQYLTFKIFPNPARDLVNIELNSRDYQKVSIDLVSSKGETVMSNDWKIIPGENTIKFGLSNISDGLYTIILNTHKEIFINKIIINH